MTSAWLFNLGAEVYAAINAQAVWAASCDRLADHFPNGSAPTVLDLGCGPGFSAIALARKRPDARIVGLDLAPRMLRVAQCRVQRARLGPRVRLLLADASRLPFQDAALDAATGHSFLYLVDRPATVLAEIWRVLRPGGRLILMEPQDQRVPLARVLRHSRDPRFLLSVALWRPYSRHHGRFTAATLGATLEAAGFEHFGAEQVLAGLGLIGWATKPRTGSQVVEEPR